MSAVEELKGIFGTVNLQTPEHHICVCQCLCVQGTGRDLAADTHMLSVEWNGLCVISTVFELPLWLPTSSQISHQSDTAHFSLLVSSSVGPCRTPAASSHTRCTEAIWGRLVSLKPALGCQMVLRKNFELFNHPTADWSCHV